MRSRVLLFVLSSYLMLALLGCSKKSAQQNASGPDANAAQSSDNNNNNQPMQNSGYNSQAQQQRPAPQPPPPLIVPRGRSITVLLGSALGSKLSQTGQTFTGTIDRDIIVDNTVAIPQGANVSGTVTDAKPLGRFAGGAVLQIRLDSISLNGNDLPLHTALRSFAEKGKGKRSAIMAGGGAALGGLIGGLVGGGKGAAVGLLAGGGAGAGGAAFTGNKEIVLPAESALTFELSEPLQVR